MNGEESGLLLCAYAVLGLSRDASAEEAEAAYHAALRKVRQEGNAWERAKEIGWAFDTIMSHLGAGAKGSGSFTPPTQPEAGPEEAAGLGRFILPLPEPVYPLSYWLRICFLLVMLLWGVRFMIAPIDSPYVFGSFMHLINLPFHEAGHLIFAFLGDFLRVLGGTLAQIIIPAACLVAFLRKHDPFGGACALWWIGQSLIDVAPYVYDARAGELPLLGGVTGREAPDFHDWHNMLERTGLLPYDHAIAYGAKGAGAVLICAALIWAGWVLARQYPCLERR